MKYTNWKIRVLGLLATTLLGLGQVRAQSAYISGTPTLNGASPAASTESADEPQNAIITIHSRVNEVNVLFIATDKHGKFVRDLNQGDFSILDDHKPPQAILNFRRETDLPLHMGLLVDTSGSVGSRFEFEQTAATAFLQHTLRKGYDRAFVTGFSTHSQVAQDFTDNVTLLSTGVHKLRNGGGTALYDAVYRACKEKFLKDRPDRPVRKAIVIVSDGEDNQSEFSKAQAIEMAQRAEVIIYAISTDDSGLVMRGDKVFNWLVRRQPLRLGYHSKRALFIGSAIDDRKKILDIIFSGAGVVSRGAPITPALEFWANPDVKGFESSVDKARVVLKDGGFTWNAQGKLMLPS